MKRLQHIATALRDTVRETDIVGRWGGEEFLIICPNTDKGNAALAADNMRPKMERLEIDIEISLSSSFGVTEFIAGDDAESLIKKADQALYVAKTSGRNSVMTS